jgi:hypothetical protein
VPALFPPLYWPATVWFDPFSQTRNTVGSVSVPSMGIGAIPVAKQFRRLLIRG